MSTKRAPIPRFGQAMIETHCHLDYLKQGPIEDLIQRATDAGIERIITIAVAPDNLTTALDLSRRFEAVFATQGIHPHQAQDYNDVVEKDIRHGLSAAKVVAVGEIGLDYYYQHAPRPVQRAAFASQLALAAELDYPVVIHSRDAETDTMAVLREHAPQLARKGVIHSFTATLELAEFCLDAGFYLGFNGIVTFKRADNVRQALAACPLDRVLLETDAPYLTPAPYRGQENAPHYLPLVAAQVAEVKQVDIAHALTSTYDNSYRLFFP